MLIYIMLYIIGLLSVFYANHIYSNRTIEEKRKKASFFCFFCFALLLALRHQSMGTDLRVDETYGYLGMYDTIAKTSWIKVITGSFLNYEKGYVIYNKLLSVLSKNRQLLLIATAFLSVLPVAKMIGKTSESPEQSFFIFMGIPLVLLYYSGLRQVIAMALCFVSIKNIQNKKLAKFIIKVLIASLFHSTALVFLPAYFIYRINITNKYRFITLGALAVIYLFRNQLLQLLAKLTRRTVEIEDTGSFLLFIFFILIYLFCVLVGKNTKEHTGYMNLFFGACVFQAFSGINSIIMRIGFYYMIFLVLLLPETISKLSNGTTRTVLNTLLFLSFTLFGLYLLNGPSYAMSNPYYFFWQVIPK